MTELIDQFGRKHTYLRISLTERCNLRCFYCMPEGGIPLSPKSSIMTLEEVIEMAKIFVGMGIDTIRLTGGEPLVRKGFDILISALAQLPIKIKITTNGVLLDRYLELFQLLGITDINVSLDTLDKARMTFITKRDYYDRIMRNVDRAIAMNMNVKFNVVLIKGINDQEISDFIEMSRGQNMTIKFIEFMPFQGNKWDWKKGVSKEEILETARSHFGAVAKLEDSKHSTSSNYFIPGFKGSFGVVSTITAPFCQGCNRLRLTADGNLKTCLFSRKEVDLLGPLRSGVALEELIASSVIKKKYSRDGMSLKDRQEAESNRSMITIGG